MAIEDIKNFVSVSSDLVTAHQPTEEQLEALAWAGFEVVVNLGVLDPRCCLRDEAGLARSLSMTYHHMPVDFKAPQFEDLKTFVEVMEASRHKKVFVHSRGELPGLDLHRPLWSGQIGLVSRPSRRAYRRVWEPNDTWQHFIEVSRRNLDAGG